MSNYIKHARFKGKIVMVGFGSVGSGVLPLLLRHLAIKANQIVIVTADNRSGAIAAEYGVKHIIKPLTRQNYRDVLGPMLNSGDFLLNVSVDVSSLALVELAREKDALYLDTCIEAWAGGYVDVNVPPAQRSNYIMREAVMEMRRSVPPDGPTAVLAHGANPGLVSSLVKQALLNIASDAGEPVATPTTREGWAELMRDLGIKVVQISERDDQMDAVPRQVDEFVNTWSIDGLISEGLQPAELGWGTHEKDLPYDGRRHDVGSGSAIYLMRPGVATRVRTWTPRGGTLHAFVITHNEAISLADYFTVTEDDKLAYRPTVYYAYHPCDATVMSLHEMAGRNYAPPEKKRLIRENIVDGMDELGVLLLGGPKGAYWFGSHLTIQEARQQVRHNGATTLQITSAVLAGMIWAIENPYRGIVEAEELDFERVLDICRPYLGEVVGVYSEWTPLQSRSQLFPEDLDLDDPWQFKNFRVV